MLKGKCGAMEAEDSDISKIGQAHGDPLIGLTRLWVWGPSPKEPPGVFRYSIISSRDKEATCGRNLNVGGLGEEGGLTRALSLGSAPCALTALTDVGRTVDCSANSAPCDQPKPH